ncbi:MAG: dTDP-4-dehydrorhamnose 3,5-epimerase [Clostridiales bacterium]|nr:dTDP-4-dehydrorhamnose 3,5-epimerase [Clostridiales bacterium]
MEKIVTSLDGVFIIEPKVFGDERGWFYESYSAGEFKRLGIDTVFVQDNRSFSATKGTLRGLHCQRGDAAQAKLVSCTRGEIIDVAVDIRFSSPTFLKHIAVSLSAANKRMLYIPRGFLHGFLTVSDDVELLYKADNLYSPADDRSVRFDDPAIGIDWGEGDFILSQKDKNAPFLKDSDVLFD